jgi:hypothetical protein
MFGCNKCSFMGTELEVLEHINRAHVKVKEGEVAESIERRETDDFGRPVTSGILVWSLPPEGHRFWMTKETYEELRCKDMESVWYVERPDGRLHRYKLTERDVARPLKYVGDIDDE